MRRTKQFRNSVIALYISAATLVILALLLDRSAVGALFNEGRQISQPFAAALLLVRIVAVAFAAALIIGASLLRSKPAEARRLLRRHKQKIFGVITLLATIVIILVVGEILARVFTASTYDLGGVEYRKQLAAIPLNSYGMRDKEYPLTPPPGTYRVLVLGDSFTFGHGIKNTSDVWTEVLERSLDEEGLPVEVINTGRNGFQTYDEIATLNKTLIFKPDMVMVGYFFNDGDTDETLLGMQRPPGPVLAAARGVDYILFTHSYLYSFMKTRMAAVRVRFGLEQSYPEKMNSAYRQPLEMHKQQLRTLRDMSESAGASFVIVLIPGNYDFSDYPLSDGHEFMQRFCAAENITCIDLLPAFAKEDYRMTRLNPYDAHPSEYGHSIIARELEPVVKAQLLNRTAGEG